MPSPITVSVNFIDFTGSAVSGYMQAAIVSPTGVYDLYVTGTGIIVPRTVSSSVGTSVSVSIWGNDVIVDMADGAKDTYYTVTLFNTSNVPIWTAAYSFTGSGAVNLVGYPSLTTLPTPTGAVPTNILTSNNVFTGTNAFSGTLSVTGPASFSGTLSTKYLENIRYADQFSGSDCGAKINAAFTDLNGTPGEVWVNQSAGLTISTAVTIPQYCVLRFIQGGTYTVSAIITLASDGSVLIGQPQSSSGGGNNSNHGPVLLKEANGANLAAVIKIIGYGGYVGYVTVDGNQANNSSGQYGIWVYHASRVKLVHASAQNCKSHNILVESSAWPANESAGGYIENSISLNAVGSAVQLLRTADWTFNKVEFENSNIGFDSVDSATSRLSNCDFGGNTTHGLSSTFTNNAAGSAGFVVVGSQFGNNGAGGSASSCDIFVNAYGSGTTAGVAPAGRGNVIVGNQFVSSSGHSHLGVQITDSGFNSIVGNTFDNFNGAALFTTAIQLRSVNATEGVDTVVGNVIEGWGSGGGASLTAVANTYAMANTDTAHQLPAGDITLTAGGLTAAAAIRSNTGFNISGSATSGHVLRGNGTNYVDSALAATDLSDYAQGTWAPSATNLTQVGGSATLSGTYTKIGRQVFWTLKVVPVTNTSSTANSTFFTGLPYTPSDNMGCSASDDAVVSYGNGLVTTVPRVYTPTWGTVTNPVRVWGVFST